MNQKQINKHKNIPLSDSDVMRLVEKKAKIVIYSDLNDFDSLDEVMGEHEACFLLYEFKKDFGHWTCLFKMKDGKTIEFFDPYGIFPDTELDWIPKNFRKISGQDYPLLTSLLYYSPYNLTYNQHAFQKKGEGINTCGRWCALRLVFRELSLKGFVKLFKKTNGDDLVSILTSYDLDY